MASKLISISVVVGCMFVLTSSAALAAEKDVVVINTPDVNVINTPDVNVTNTPDVFVANTPDVMVQNTPANPVPVSVVTCDTCVTPYQRRFQVWVAPSGSRLVGSIDIDHTIPPGTVLKVKAVNFGSASSPVSSDVAIEVSLQDIAPLFARQTFFGNISMPNAAGVRLRGHYMTEFLIGRTQSDIRDNIEVALYNVALVETVVEITLTGELLPSP